MTKVILTFTCFILTLGIVQAVEDNKRTGKWWRPYPSDDPKDTYGIIHKKFMFNGGHEKWYGIVANGVPAEANGSKSPTRDSDPFLANNHKISKQPHHYETESGELFVEGVRVRNVDGNLPFYSDGKTTNVRLTTDWLADRAKEFITDFKNDDSYEPFFFVMSIPDPRTPDIVRASYDTMYTDMDFALRRTWNDPNFNPDDPFKSRPGYPNWIATDGKATDVRVADKKGKYTIQEKTSQYFGMVKCIDDNVGRVIKHLENEGLLQDTIILFSSDHGDLFGEHRRVNKGTPHDTALRIPFVLVDGIQLVENVSEKTPLVPRGKIIEQAGNTTDWPETFLSLLNATEIPETPGRNLTALFDTSTADDGINVSNSRKYWIAATDHRHKLVLDFQGADAWLYDLERDPDEYINFIDNPHYVEAVLKFVSAVNTYMVEKNERDHDVADAIGELLQKRDEPLSK